METKNLNNEGLSLVLANNPKALKALMLTVGRIIDLAETEEATEVLHYCHSLQRQLFGATPEFDAAMRSYIDTEGSTFES